MFHKKEKKNFCGMDANGFSNETLTTKKKHNRVIGGKKKKKSRLTI